MAIKVNHLFFFILSLLSSFSMIAQSSFDCVYTVQVKTATMVTEGKDPIINLRLYDLNGDFVDISNLKTWGGQMGPNHDYFARGNLDTFKGLGKCLNGSVCAMRITFEGLGQLHGWYCKYVKVTSTRAQGQCAERNFRVEQWLTNTTWPYTPTATIDYCSSSVESM